MLAALLIFVFFFFLMVDPILVGKTIGMALYAILMTVRVLLAYCMLVAIIAVIVRYSCEEKLLSEDNGVCKVVNDRSQNTKYKKTRVDTKSL